MRNREKFEQWAKNNGMSLSLSAFRGGTFCNQVTEMAFRAWQARQPEIDAKSKVIDDLALQKGVLKAEIGRLEAEVERLRKDLGARQKLDDRFKGRKTRIDGADIGIPCFDESAMKETK